MKKQYRLTYARVVILQATFTAESEEEAWKLAGQAEAEGRLGLADLRPASGSWVKDVTDYDAIWEMELEPRR